MNGHNENKDMETGKGSRKYVSYLRVSTDRQGKSGLGLEAQRVAVQRFFDARGIDGEVPEFIEVESGSKNDRPKLQQALLACRIHKATLVVAKLDRLARDAHFLLGLKDAGIDFICCDMPSANRMTVSIMAIVAEEERNMISQRTKAALQQAKARGVKLGKAENLNYSARLQGNKNSQQARTTKAQQFRKDLTPIIHKIKAAGITSLNGIARELNAMGIPTSRGGLWKASQVGRLGVF